MCVVVCVCACACVSGVITGYRLFTILLGISLSQPIRVSRCTVSTTSTVCGLMSVHTAGDTQYRWLLLSDYSFTYLQQVIHTFTVIWRQLCCVYCEQYRSNEDSYQYKSCMCLWCSSGMLSYTYQYDERFYTEQCFHWCSYVGQFDFMPSHLFALFLLGLTSNWYFNFILKHFVMMVQLMDI